MNYDLPDVPEDYVHRIGRTGRAGVPGHAVSLVSPEDRPLLSAIEKLLKEKINLIVPAQYAGPQPEDLAEDDRREEQNHHQRLSQQSRARRRPAAAVKKLPSLPRSPLKTPALTVTAPRLNAAVPPAVIR